MRVSKHQGGAECLVLRSANLALVRHFHSKPVNFGQNLGFAPSLAKYAVSRKPPKMLYLYRFLSRALKGNVLVRNRLVLGKILRLGHALIHAEDFPQDQTITDEDIPF